MSPSTRAGAAKLRTLLDQIQEPIFLLDGRRRLVYANRAWEALTGLATASVLGFECSASASASAALPGGNGSDSPALACFSPTPEAQAGRPSSRLSLILQPDGARTWHRLEFFPLHEAHGNLHGYLGFVRPREVEAIAPESDVLHLRAELDQLRERLRARHGTEALIGRGAAHRRLLDQINAAMATRVPVLVVGEPGTGRRTVARTIHQGHPSSLVTLDCAALPPEVLERELFGKTERSTTTGSDSRTLALNAGTTLLLLDVFELPRDLQADLASALGDGVRLLATGAIEPELALRQDRLRPDLYYALTTLVLRLPPLRDRLDELPLLAQHFLEQENARSHRIRLGFELEARQALLEYDWPGNLRELARVIAAAHEHAEGETVTVNDLPALIRGHLGAAYLPAPEPPRVIPLDEQLMNIERQLIEQALQRARQNKSRASELLGISRPRLYRRIKELNLPDLPDGATPDESAGSNPDS